MLHPSFSPPQRCPDFLCESFHSSVVVDAAEEQFWDLISEHKSRSAGIAAIPEFQGRMVQAKILVCLKVGDSPEHMLRKLIPTDISSLEPSNFHIDLTQQLSWISQVIHIQDSFDEAYLTSVIKVVAKIKDAKNLVANSLMQFPRGRVLVDAVVTKCCELKEAREVGESALTQVSIVHQLLASMSESTIEVDSIAQLQRPVNALVAAMRTGLKGAFLSQVAEQARPILTNAQTLGFAGWRNLTNQLMHTEPHSMQTCADRLIELKLLKDGLLALLKMFGTPDIAVLTNTDFGWDCAQAWRLCTEFLEVLATIAFFTVEEHSAEEVTRVRISIADAFTITPAWSTIAPKEHLDKVDKYVKKLLAEEGFLGKIDKVVFEHTMPAIEKFKTEVQDFCQAGFKVAGLNGEELGKKVAFSVQAETHEEALAAIRKTGDSKLFQQFGFASASVSTFVKLAAVVELQNNKPVSSHGLGVDLVKAVQLLETQYTAFVARSQQEALGQLFLAPESEVAHINSLDGLMNAQMCFDDVAASRAAALKSLSQDFSWRMGEKIGTLRSFLPGGWLQHREDILNQTAAKTALLSNKHYVEVGPAAGHIREQLDFSDQMKKHGVTLLDDSMEEQANELEKEACDCVGVTYAIWTATVKLPGIPNKKDIQKEIDLLKAGMAKKGISMPESIALRLAELENA